MRKTGPLVLVEDDSDDQELIMLALNSLGLTNEVVLCKDGEEALKYLYSTTDIPFLILSDINMPRMDGIAFKKKIDSCEILKGKCIPFIFISTSSSTPLAKNACDLSIQGLFEKGNSHTQLLETLKIILKYWNKTSHLN
jgi:CheY-like chemotaxis protein